MYKKTFSVFISILLAGYIFSTKLHAEASRANETSNGTVSETGKTGMSFLAVIPSARTASLGGMASALPIGASSVWSNPSLIALQSERSAQFTHTEWIDGIKQDYAAVSTPSRVGHFGLAFRIFDSGDIELRDNVPSPNPLGTYSIKNVSLSMTYARSITEKIAAGITFKKLFEKISDENAGGYAFDGGIIMETPLKNVSVSAVARNYGRMGKLKNERTKLPSDLAVGTRYSGVVDGLVQSYSVLADVVVPRYGDSGVRLGVEVEPTDRLFLRMGYRSDSDIETVSFGLGFSIDRVIGDISYTPMTEGFDSALRFMLSISGF
ncbi:PorV/PorQ family protein [Candidatus Omnitrophota bacterium]